MKFHYIISRKTFFKGSAMLAATTVASYALGLLRDRQFAQVFGASHALDAYQAAFLIPDLLLNIFVAGALTAAFIPLVSELRASRGERETSDFISSVLNGSVLVVLAAGIVVFTAAPWIAELLVGSFPPDAKAQYINLLRLMVASPIIFAVSNTLGNLLVAHERFFWYGISAALYNLGIIVGTALFASRWGIYGAGIGVLIGAFLHLAPRLMTAGRLFSYRALLSFDGYFRKFFRLMLPKMIGHPVEQLTFLGFTVIAAALGGGAIAILNFARNFQSAPVAVVGITFSMTIFPIIARAAAARERVTFFSEMKSTTVFILLITIPSAIIMYLIREPLIALLLGGGEFGPESVRATAAVLGLFTLAIPTESLGHLFARGFYALQNSLTPVLISVGGLLFSIGSGYFLSRTMGVPGLALGFFIGSLVKIVFFVPLLVRESRKLS